MLWVKFYPVRKATCGIRGQNRGITPYFHTGFNAPCEILTGLLETVAMTEPQNKGVFDEEDDGDQVY